MELKIGKNTTKELAQWFGISYDTFRHKKADKLKELLNYCQYEIVYGGVIISKIYIAEYIKPTPKYMFIKQNFRKHWHTDGYDTAARVGAEMYQTYKDTELEGLKESTIKAYVAKARLESYGYVYLDSHGEVGSCRPAPIRSNKWDAAILLTEEEYALYKEIRASIYYDERAAELEVAYITHQLTGAEYDQLKEQHEKEWKEQAFERYLALKESCVKRLGFSPDIVTKLEEEMCFND